MPRAPRPAAMRATVTALPRGASSGAGVRTAMRAGMPTRAHGAAASHVRAGVHAPDLAGDVRRGVRGQEVHDARDLFRLPEAAERNLRQELLHDLRRDVLEHLRRNEPRRDGVDREPDAGRVWELARAAEEERG